MLKDIYSPLEIDEQWDQRAAPMMDGDALGQGDMYHAAPDVGGGAATMEASAPVTIEAGTQIQPDASAEPAVTNEKADDSDQSTTVSHFGGETTETAAPSEDSEKAEAQTGNASEVTTTETAEPTSEMQAMPEKPDSMKTDSADSATSDDEAVAQMGGAETDTTEAPEEGGVKPAEEPATETPATAEASDEPKAFIPTESFTPEHVRDQSKAEDKPEAKDEKIGTDQSADADSNDSGIVMADHHDGDHKEEDTSPEMPVAPPIAPEAESGMNNEASSDDIDTKIEKAMSKIDEAIDMLKADKEQAAAALAQHEHDESEARAAKEHAQAEVDKVDSELTKLEGLKTAA